MAVRNSVGKTGINMKTFNQQIIGGLAPRAVVGRLGPFGAHPPPQPRAAGQAHERRLAGADRLQVCA